MIDTLQYLSQAAKLVDGDHRTNKLLHCYYLSRIQTLAAIDNISVEKSSYSSCDKCTIPFSDSRTFSLSIQPRKITKQKYKKLVTNSECKGRDDSGSLLKLKGKLGQKYKRLVYNIAETTCKLCNSNRKSSIRFESKEKSKPKPYPPTVQRTEFEFDLSKPKKRRRDKNAGLILKDNKTISTIDLISSSPRSVVKVMQTKPPVHKVVPTKLKTNKDKKSKKSTIDKRTTKNVTSDQKQRKSILLLANALKMNDPKLQQNSSHQLQLSKMFK